MYEFFRDFFSKRDFFERSVRGVLLGVTGASAAGQIPLPPEYAWIPAVVAGFIAVGEKNAAAAAKVLALFVAIGLGAAPLSASAAETCIPFDGTRLDLTAANSIRVCAPWTTSNGTALDPAKSEIQKCEAIARYGAGNTASETLTLQAGSNLPPGAIITAAFANAYTIAGDTDDTLLVRCYGRPDKTIPGSPLAWAEVAPQPATFRSLPGIGVPGRAVTVP